MQLHDQLEERQERNTESYQEGAKAQESASEADHHEGGQAGFLLQLFRSSQVYAHCPLPIARLSSRTSAYPSKIFPP